MKLKERTNEPAVRLCPTVDCSDTHSAFEPTVRLGWVYGRLRERERLLTIDEDILKCKE